MSSGRGSSIDASCCAARKMRLSFSSACSSARVELGRPITNGIIMCGKTTTSRSGTIGRVSYTSNGVSIFKLMNSWVGELVNSTIQTHQLTNSPISLSGFLDQRDRLVPGHHDFARDRHFADL